MKLLSFYKYFFLLTASVPTVLLPTLYRFYVKATKPVYVNRFDSAICEYYSIIFQVEESGSSMFDISEFIEFPAPANQGN